MSNEAPFVVEQTHGIVTRSQDKNRISSDLCGWKSLYASTQREVPYEDYFAAVADQLIVMHLDGPAAIYRSHRSVRERCDVPAGGFHLVPGGMDFNLRLGSSLSTLHVYVRRAIIEEVAVEMMSGDPATLQIPPQFLGPDAALTNLLAAVKHALVNDDYGIEIYMDYLTRSLAALLVHNYSGKVIRARSTIDQSGEVSPILAKALDYMRAHLNSQISLSDIARVVNQSPSHFARQFRSAVGMPPHQYLLALRLKNAQHLLSSTRISIAQIAFECGFAHQEHLTRMFRRWSGTTPAAFRKCSRE